MSATEHEELRIFVERFMHFMNLWTLYKDMLTGHYKPSYGEMLTANDPEPIDNRKWPVNITMMFVLYAFFYSLIEDSGDGLNGFTWPQEEAAIAAVEARVIPFRHRTLFYLLAELLEGSGVFETASAVAQKQLILAEQSWLNRLPQCENLRTQLQ